MTNEEKAYEISQSSLIEDGIWHYATAEIAAITMAEWKDQQFKEQKAIDDAELAEVRRQRDAYYDELLKLRVKKLEWIDKALSFLRIYGEGDFSCAEEFEAKFRKAMEE